MTKIDVGQRVVALVEITEESVPGDPNARFPDPAYIFAREGDVGDVKHVTSGGRYRVYFESAVASVLVSPKDVRLFTPSDDKNPELDGVCQVCHERGLCMCGENPAMPYVRFLESALDDLLDGLKGPHEVYEQTGLGDERCKEIWDWWQRYKEATRENV